MLIQVAPSLCLVLAYFSVGRIQSKTYQLDFIFYQSVTGASICYRSMHTWRWTGYGGKRHASIHILLSLSLSITVRGPSISLMVSVIAHFSRMIKVYVSPFAAWIEVTIPVCGL